jgi:hypothetical protein
VNAAFVDGHVEARWIKDIVSRPNSRGPVDNPEWTRDAD